MKITYGAGKTIAQAVMRDKVCRLEAELKALPQADIPVREYFADGMYAREVTLPAGAVCTGAVHKTQHITVISKGIVQVLRPEGPQEYAAPCTFISEPGTKNAVHVLKDAVWTTFHPNVDNGTDSGLIIERLTTSKACHLLGGGRAVQIEGNT